MSDTVKFVPENVKRSAGSIVKEVIGQIIGTPPNKNQEEQTKKLAEKAEKSGRTIEEQAKLESLRKQLHAQVTAPHPSSTEQPIGEKEDKVGTNEGMQSLGDNPNQANANTLPPLAQPSMRHGERLKIRE
jgi:hypothetical protein